MAGHTKAKRLLILKHYEQTGQIEAGIIAAGVHRSQHFRWLKKYPEYAKQYERIRDQLIEAAEHELYRRAVTGIERPVTVAGKREVIREFSDDCLKFLLRGRRREVFGDTSQVDVKIAGELSIADVLRQRIKKNEKP